MWKTVGITLLLSLGLLLVCVLAMAFKPLFIKGGRFPNIHIGGNKAMRERGIDCVQTQDRKARQQKK